MWLTAIAVTALLALAATAFYVGGRLQDRKSEGAGTVGAKGLELRHPAGATLKVPPGALPSGTKVTLQASKPAELSKLGLLQPDGVAWEILADHEPTMPVNFTVPYDPTLVPEDAHPTVATYDEITGWWIPLGGEADPSTQRIIAQLPSFSLKTWFIDRVTDVGDQVVNSASWLEYQGGRLLGNRVDKPECREPRPQWVTDVITVEDDNAQLFACAEKEGDGFQILMANNRSYPVAIDFDAPFSSSKASLLDDGLTGLLERLATESGERRIFLLPTGSGAVSYNPVPKASGHVEGFARRDPSAMLIMLAVEAMRIADTDVPLPNGKQLGVWTVDCLLRMLDGSGKVISGDIAAAGSALTDCLIHTLEHEVRLWGFDPKSDLWSGKATGRLPSGAQRAIGALRWLRGTQVAKWSLTAADLLINDRGSSADLIDVAVHWRNAATFADLGRTVWLYTRRPEVQAVGTSGQQVDGELGGRHYRQSTGAWVGCEGSPATLIYNLNGEYQQLDAVVGLAPFTPAGLSAEVEFKVDGASYTTIDVTRDSATPVTINLAGAAQLSISAMKTVGECTVSSIPYGILGDAKLAVGRIAPSKALPQRFIGKWRGMVTQPGSVPNPYTMELLLEPGAVGSSVGTVKYLELECGGRVTLNAASALSAQVTEQIDYGSVCVPVVSLWFRVVDEERIFVSMHTASAIGGTVCCWGTLAKA